MESPIDNKMDGSEKNVDVTEGGREGYSIVAGLDGVASVFKCDKCGKTGAHRGMMRRHVLTHEEGRLKCETCGRVFRHKTSLNRHLAVHSMELTHKCSLCQKHFRFVSGLNYHMLVHADSREFACKICTYQARNKSKLKEHLATHGAKDGKYKCTRGCTLEFTSADAWIKHFNETPMCNFTAESVAFVNVNPLDPLSQTPSLVATKFVGHNIITTTTLNK
jgi:hypothetical protein